MKIISVIPLKKGILKGDLTYFTALKVSAGDIVSVPIRKKNTLALVVSSEELAENKANIKELNFNLRKVIETKGGSIFLKEFIQSAFETAKYFAQEKNAALPALMPSVFLENYDSLLKMVPTKKSARKFLDFGKNIRSEKLLMQNAKTERISHYKTLVRESFARDKSVFLVLPTEHDIEEFVSSLSKGIEQFTFSLQSSMSKKKILSHCQQILQSPHPLLVIATAPFLALPKTGIGTVILEHESSNAYRTIRRPHLDLRVFIEIYASKINAKLIIADKLLRFETIARMETEGITAEHPLSYRIDSDSEIKLVSSTRKENKRFKVLQEESTAEITQALKHKKNIFIYSLRKGLSTMTVCRDCGETLLCERCLAPLVLYISKNEKRMFVCNRCEKSYGADMVCKNCGSWNLAPLGIGTDTVSEELKKQFPKVKIFKLDKESARSGSNAKKIAREFLASRGAILIGTEMAFFYLDKKVPVSIIASLDSLWSIPGFRMGERALQIMLSIAEFTTEKFIIQSKNPDDPAFLSVLARNVLPFVKQELEDREKFGFPSFKKFIKIKHLGDRESAAEARKMLEEKFKEYSPDIFGGFVERLKGKYATNALIKLEPHKWSLPELSAGTTIDKRLEEKLKSLPPYFEVLVDPEDLL